MEQCREDIRLAGKTGTAELKATKEDTSRNRNWHGLQFLLQDRDYKESYFAHQV